MAYATRTGRVYEAASWSVGVRACDYHHWNVEDDMTTIKENNEAMDKKFDEQIAFIRRTDERFDELMHLLWDFMDRTVENGKVLKPRRMTGWGSKTQLGLWLSVKGLMDIHNKPVK